GPFALRHVRSKSFEQRAAEALRVQTPNPSYGIQHARAKIQVLPGPKPADDGRRRTAEGTGPCRLLPYLLLLSTGPRDPDVGFLGRSELDPGIIALPPGLVAIACGGCLPCPGVPGMVDAMAGTHRCPGSMRGAGALRPAPNQGREH